MTPEEAKKTGVADYFAIIGTGDQLVWKHTQKQGHFGESIETLEEEDEGILEERFLREIVDITIVAIDDEATTASASKPAAHSRAPSDASLLSLAASMSFSLPGVASYQTEGSSQDHTIRSTTFQPLPASPSHSDATTGIEVAATGTTASAAEAPPPSSREPMTASGWSIIHKTRPAGRVGHVMTSYDDDDEESTKVGPTLFHKNQVFDANLDWQLGLRGQLVTTQQAILKQHQSQQHSTTTSLKGLRRKMESTLRKLHSKRASPQAMVNPKFFLAFRRRRHGSDVRPAVASVQLLYLRLHRSSLPRRRQGTEPSGVTENAANHSAMAIPLGLAGQILERYQSQAKHPEPEREDESKLVEVQDYIALPEGFVEWSIPDDYHLIRDPLALATPRAHDALYSRHRAPRTVIFAHDNDDDTILSGHSGAGVEAVEANCSEASAITDPDLLFPKLLMDGVPEESQDDVNFFYVPVLALRRLKCGDEERFHEDPAIVDLAISFDDGQGDTVLPGENSYNEDDEDDEQHFSLLGKTAWKDTELDRRIGSWRGRHLGRPVILVRHNQPFGFADAAFATRVLDRFPSRNYKGMPLPEEELPMFCYPTGCRLYRARFSDAPLPQYYGFVVKNERGDSIYVSCVSFMEPLTTDKSKQLALMSARRRHTSLAHRIFCESKNRRKDINTSEKKSSAESVDSDGSAGDSNHFLLTAFDDMTTFENKTICLVGRYPFWTALRKFLSNLHIMSGSSLSLPLERYISHLLLSIPVPRPGGCNILVPLPALNDPMVLWMPPEKDFPIVDLSFQPLFGCLEIKTVVMMVLGMLALERKIIVMSTRPSLVLDICELLRSLLFPFELCAPYVPRLTEPFQSSLDFPGAIFVGIHDDSTAHGLAATVRREIPEDAIIVDLDTGAISCDGDRYEVITKSWDLIPISARSSLVEELQTLCRDAGVIDGQEPLDAQFDSAFAVSLSAAVSDHDIGCESREPIDDRAVRDAFLRFFCFALGGYERFLVVPDADFLVSGNEWFDAQGFLTSVSSERVAYLSVLVSTQLFQSFIQKRTEASDVHCMLFDECVAEFHSSPVPYGRLGGDVEAIVQSDSDKPHMMYSLLVDQCAALSAAQDQSTIGTNKSMDASEADSSFTMSKVSTTFTEISVRNGEAAYNPSGDLVTFPSRAGLPDRRMYVYCADGNPAFPIHLNAEYFLPKEPVTWNIEISKIPIPLLARGERELDDANRRRRMATSLRGMQKQRRCLWQLPKLMGSHFLGIWSLCIPAIVSQPRISGDQQAKYLLRALGAIRLLRSRQRIVPDEAAYRALMAACGRCSSDRRVELVKLFGLLRSDGIFPSAVTLGQYTRALAEGYTKRSAVIGQDGIGQDEDYGGVEVTESASRVGRLSVVSLNLRGSVDQKSPLCALDTHLAELELHGRRWRHRNGEGGIDDDAEHKKKRSRSWLPVCFSSSFLPNRADHQLHEEPRDVRLTALWSRTRGCSSCAYIPLEEETQAGWDVVGGENEIAGAVACPRCGSLIVPMLGVKEMSIAEALDLSSSIDKVRSDKDRFADDSPADFADLPPQIRPEVDSGADMGVAFVTYISPVALRLSLEHYVEEFGEAVLERDSLRRRDPEVFYNLWWYCARFSLPLPLPINGATQTDEAYDACAFIAWDEAVAKRGCYSAASVFSLILNHDDLLHGPSETALTDNYEDCPLLSRFNLQSYYSTVWDHVDLSKILVALVEACDKRDFKCVVESVLHANARRRDEFGLDVEDTGSEVHNKVDVLLASDPSSVSPQVEFDLYRVALYLAKYQCTTAFHAFFPATAKPCKGYHFWCAIGTPLPIFDRLFRDGVLRINTSKDNKIVIPSCDVSEVALGFRCVFGHLI